MSYLLDPQNYQLSDSGSIPNLLVQHLIIVATSMLIALVIAIPLGIVVARYRRLYLPIIGLADFAYTIPAIALLALLVPYTGLNATTIIIPLILYAQLVLIRNTAEAISGIDPLLIEVGKAMGLNRIQLFLRVTLPLALPVIIAGIRIAMVTSIGIATLGSLAGADTLGNLIFLGINNLNYAQVVAGSILVSILAVVADLLLLGLQLALNRGRNRFSLA